VEFLIAMVFSDKLEVSRFCGGEVKYEDPTRTINGGGSLLFLLKLRLEGMGIERDSIPR